MKKIYYESPTVEVVEVRVESGFIGSTFENGNSSSFGVSYDGDMEETTYTY